MGYDETRTIRSDPCDRVTYWTDWIRSPGPCVPIPLREGWVVYYVAVSNFRISPNISEQKSAGSGVNRNDGGVAASCHLARRHVCRQFNNNSRGLHLMKRDMCTTDVSVFLCLRRCGGLVGTPPSWFGTARVEHHFCRPNSVVADPSPQHPQRRLHVPR